MSTHALSATGVMLGRSVRHITRSLDTIITVTIMPIAFLLLFVFVFGGAIRSGTDIHACKRCWGRDSGSDWRPAGLPLY